MSGLALEPVEGTVPLTVAVITWSPSLTPDITWVRSASAAPTMTWRVSGLPLTSTWTLEPFRTALVGTVRTWVAWLMTIDTAAEVPAWSEGLLPSIVTVTGKVATPEVTVATAAIAVTLPVSAWVAPAGVMRAAWPMATWPTWASLTAPVTM